MIWFSRIGQGFAVLGGFFAIVVVRIVASFLFALVFLAMGLMLVLLALLSPLAILTGGGSDLVQMTSGVFEALGPKKKEELPPKPTKNLSQMGRKELISDLLDHAASLDIRIRWAIQRGLKIKVSRIISSGAQRAQVEISDPEDDLHYSWPPHPQKGLTWESSPGREPLSQPFKSSDR